MEVHESTTPEATHKQSLIQRIFRGCIRFLETFLFIMFMTHNLLVSMRVDIQWHEPIASVVAFSCFVCVTIGANCWFGDQVIRWRSYCIASIVTFAFYFVYLVFLGNNTNYFVNNLQLTVITSLPVVSAIYSIWKIRQAKKKTREGVVSNLKHLLSKRSIALANTVRFVALISFCSVFLENAQRILLLVFDPELRMPRMFPLSEAVDAIVAAYAIWLLICFARKEFVQAGGQEESEKDCVEYTSEN